MEPRSAAARGRTSPTQHTRRATSKSTRTARDRPRRVQAGGDRQVASVRGVARRVVEPPVRDRRSRRVPEGPRVKRDKECTGLKEHVYDVHWEPNSYGSDNPRGPYISIGISLNCGCSIHALAAFAAEMREQQGWDVAKSGGWGELLPEGASGVAQERVMFRVSDPVSPSSGLPGVMGSRPTIIS